MRQKQSLVKNSSRTTQQDDPNEDEKINANLSNELKIERYKYILEQIHTLNQNSHKYLTLFQTLATFILGGGISLFVSWKSLKIGSETAKAGIQGLLGLLIIITLFVIISLIGGIFSWLDYRREEVELLNEAMKFGFRKMPKIRNFWRWYETYIVIFIVVVVLTILIYVETQIIPLIR